MIPTKPDIQTNITGLESNRFSIEITDKSFRVLIDGLYTNKIRSIIRELWTNAYDAHVAAGCPERSFTCKLPSSLEPVFSVRDYGISMSHEDIMHLYSTVFASTKTQTNDQVGCLGLGSKSPFAYTDSFTVIAYSGDEKRLYIAALDSDGIPVITHLSTEPSDEERGLEVSFSVDSSHVTEFNTEAKFIGEGFAIKPEIEGMDFHVDTPVFEAEGFTIYSTDNHNRRWINYYIKQGVVMYPVPDEIKTPKVIKNGYYCVVDVPIGSVEFAASRESLQLTDKTRNYVTSTIEQYMESFVATARLDIFNKSTKLEAWKTFCKWSDMIADHMIETAWGDGSIKFNSYNYGFKLNDIKLQVWNGKTIESIHKSRDTTTMFTRTAIESGMFVINRGEKIPRRLLRFKEFDKTNSNVFWLDFPTNKHIERLMRCLGITKKQFVSLKDIPDVEAPQRTATDAGALQGATMLKKNRSNAYASWSFSRILDVDKLPEKWCYIPMPSAQSGQDLRLDKLKYRITFNPSARWVDNNLPSLIDGLKSLTDEDGKSEFDYEVIFVSPRAIKKLGLDDEFGFVTIPKFEDVAYDLIKSHGAEIHAQRTAMRSNNRSSIYHHSKVEAALGMERPDISHTILNLDLPEVWAGLETNSDVDYAEKYPLLFTNTPTLEQIQEYIDFIDSKENK